MTFFLKDGALPDVEARGVDTPLPSFWGGVSAAFQKEQLESNSNFRRQRETLVEEGALAVEAARHMGADRVRGMVDALNEKARAQGLPEREMPADLADLSAVFGPNFAKSILDEARNEPAWDGPDVSPETVEKRLNERMQKEHKDATETMSAMGGGAGVAGFIGAAGGMLADVRNVPFLFGGGGGSIARVMGREAMLNVAAEAATLPDRFEMAERLNIPDPDIATTLAMAAVGGAALGGAVEGLARGITYWRGTRAIPSERVAAYDVEMNVDVAEDAIADGARVFDVVPEQIRETPKAEQAAEPRIDAPQPRLADDAAPVARAADTPPVEPPRSAEQALSDLFDQPGSRGGVGERQVDIEDLIAESRAAEQGDAVAVSAPLDDPLPVSLERQLSRDAGGKRPLIQHMTSRYGGISPTSRLGQELRAMGITSKDVPGLFRKNGRAGFDNIPANEEPYLASMLGEDGNGYLNEDAIATAIAEEISGRPMPVSPEQQAARVELDERRIEQERRDREAAISAGRELDEMDRWPEVPGWLDDPKAVEAVEGHALAQLRDEVELAPEVPRVDPDKPAFMDTRGEGVRYHGSRSANTGITEGHYASLNYYGNGFYTTDAVSIGHGYAGGDKGFLYEVVETRPVRALDMEGPVPDFLRRDIEMPRREFSLERAALEEDPANVRELFDNIRDMSSYERVSADEVQEIFEGFYDLFRDNGFNAIDHVGGLRTTKTPHNVRIYLEPGTTIRLEKRTFDEFRVPERAAPVAEPTAPPLRAERPPRPVDPATAEMRAEGGRLVDMGDGKGERPLSSVLDELDADAEFADVIQACGRVPF